MDGRCPLQDLLLPTVLHNRFALFLSVRPSEVTTLDFISSSFFLSPVDSLFLFLFPFPVCFINPCLSFPLSVCYFLSLLIYDSISLKSLYPLFSSGSRYSHSLPSSFFSPCLSPLISLSIHASHISLSLSHLLPHCLSSCPTSPISLHHALHLFLLYFLSFFPLHFCLTLHPSSSLFHDFSSSLSHTPSLSLLSRLSPSSFPVSVSLCLHFVPSLLLSLSFFFFCLFRSTAKFLFSHRSPHLISSLRLCFSPKCY